MQVVILAGGLGTRLSKETDLIPKPMVRIGNVPILRHIMNYYAKFGHTEFMRTYGDGLSNVDLNQLLNRHGRFKKVAKVTSVRPPARFGTIDISHGIVTKFTEKNPQDAGWVNGGFFCLIKRFVHSLWT